MPPPGNGAGSHADPAGTVAIVIGQTERFSTRVSEAEDLGRTGARELRRDDPRVAIGKPRQAVDAGKRFGTYRLPVAAVSTSKKIFRGAPPFELRQGPEKRGSLMVADLERGFAIRPLLAGMGNVRSPRL